MSDGIFATLVTQPMYNGLVALLALSPAIDLGLAVIIFTILVRLLLFPLAQKALATQMAQQKLQPELERIREEYKNDREQLARRMMALYKEAGINPLASFFFLLIQLPIIFGLYFVFLRGGFPAINAELLYSFVEAPAGVSPLFLGILDVTQKKILLFAVIAGVTQFVQAWLMQMPAPPKSDPSKPSFAADLAKSMSLQMKYVLPVVVAFISYTLPASVALYWATSNLFSIGQEWWLRRKYR